MIDDNFVATVQAMILTLPRITVLLWVLPFLDQQVFSRGLRVAVAVSLSFLILPSVVVNISDTPLPLISACGIFFKEAFLGALLGYGASILFWAISTSGYIIDMQRGAFTASLFSPAFQDQVSPFGALFVHMLVVIFFSSGVVLLLLQVLYSSYEVWPVLGLLPEISASFLDVIISLFVRMMEYAIILVAPLILIMLLIDLAMGIINRFVPQLQVFFLAMPIKGVAAMSLLLLYLPLLIDYLNSQLHEQLPEALRSITGSML